ncbi:Putative auto-transporter adhesin, head GIN domain [Flavobacterium sp. CF108]|uniref:head GIN domain-containing protein n=1 Tax=unclassified Flavobacterium TaxID=196869 RepID=UPI0008D0CD26|nr:MULTISPECIES: head GIN domain-containing protein [unclassified Flavobacterium]SEN69676.1 Putative auto-transporter adhesin, head GIN domain [Flavobacterium sp. fv08]SHH09007.1 Putative auto-transporter adhesin, head GIN domain [Flavobacterium sp. CF108]
MKKLIIGAAILFVQMSFGQVTKELGDFDTVKVYDKLSVKLIPSSENKVVIKGAREAELEAVNKNGVLKLRMPFPKLLSGNDLEVTLYYKHIELIDVNEGAEVISKEAIKATSFKVSAQEGGKINVDLNVDKLKVSSVSGGEITATGKADNLDASLGAGGYFLGSKLATSQTKISVSAGGKADVNASTLVDAKVSAGGSIYIYGKPKQINQKTVFGGKIEEVK